MATCIHRKKPCLRLVSLRSLRRILSGRKITGKTSLSLRKVLGLLVADQAIPVVYRDHTLTGSWVGYRELHLEPNWLLVYYIEDDVLALTLARTGNHSDLCFKLGLPAFRKKSNILKHVTN